MLKGKKLNSYREVVLESRITDFDKKIKRYDVALATRNFEIELFWKRSIFFWGFIASSFIGYSSLIKDKPILSLIIACFGFVCSISWSLVNRGSKYWQENWEEIVASIEDDITGSLFKKRKEQINKGLWLSSRKYSVSKVTIALSDFAVIIWTLILSYHICISLSPGYKLTLGPTAIYLMFFSFVFAIFIGIFARSTDAKKS